MLNNECFYYIQLYVLNASGVLLGVAVRTQKPIAVNLCPLVWKMLVGCSVTWDDVEAVDLNYARSVRSAESAPVDHFEGVSVSGSHVPLFPGSSRLVRLQILFVVPTVFSHNQ